MNNSGGLAGPRPVGRATGRPGGAHFEEFQSHEHPLPAERTFGWVLGSLVGVLALRPLAHRHSPNALLAGIAVLLLLAAAMRPAVLRTLNRAWMSVGLVLGHLVNPIVLGAVFFLVVTPIGLLMRLVGQRPLGLRFDQRASTYWLPRPMPSTLRDAMRDQF